MCKEAPVFAFFFTKQIDITGGTILNFNIGDNVIVTNVFSPYKYTTGKLIAINNPKCGIETGANEIIILDIVEISRVASAEIKRTRKDMRQAANNHTVTSVQFDDNSIMYLTFANPIGHPEIIHPRISNGNQPFVCVDSKPNGWYLFTNFTGKVYILKIKTIK